MKKMARLVASLILAGALAAPAIAGFEFHGYGRAGVLLNSKGALAGKGETDQGTFDLNGPAIPFLHNVGRLGNENDNYMEAELTNTFKAGTVGAATKMRFASKDWNYTTYPYRGGNTEVTNTAGDKVKVSTGDEAGVFLRELYTEFYGLPFAPKSTVWAGKRFYGRDDIHINDFYWRIFDGTGAGVMNVPAGPGVIDFAWVSVTNSKAGDYPMIKDDEGKDVGQDVQQNFDLRYRGVKALGGEFEVEVTPSIATGSINNTNKTADRGIQGAVVYSRADFFGGLAGSSKVAFQAGKGLGANVGNGNGTFMHEDAMAMQFVAWGVANVTDKLKVSPSFVYSNISKREGAKHGNGDDKFDWMGFTVRPQYNFTRNLALQAEIGYEKGDIWAPVESWGSKKGLVDADILKITVAPTITLDDTSFWTRPQLRAFVTYASFDKNATKAGINDKSLAGKDNGVTYGVQMESWF